MRPSVRRPQPGGAQPLADLRSCFALAGASHQSITFDTWRCAAGFIAQLFSLVGKTLLKGLRMFELPPLRHGALLSVSRKAGARDGDLITDRYLGPLGDDQVTHAAVRSSVQKCTQIKLAACFNLLAQ